MLRGLIYHWRVHLAVTAGAAVATAVLAGAVILGDSMQASLRKLTLDRLGDIEWALTAAEPFRDELADDLRQALGENGLRVAPVMISSASAVHAESRAFAAGVSLFGIDERFEEMFPEQAEALADGLARQRGQIFPSVVINRSLARETDLEPGDDVLFSFEQLGDVPRESLLGNLPAEGEVTALRATVSAILPDRGPGRFSTASHQQRSRNAFVELGVLTSRLESRGRVNALFTSSISSRPQPEIEAALDSAVSFDDLGIDLEAGEAVLRVSNRRFVLRDTTVGTLVEAAKTDGLESQQVLGYLANRLSLGEGAVPYSMILGIDTPIAPLLGSLSDLDGKPMSRLNDNEIVLGEWAARELDAQPGDVIEVTYFAVGANDALIEQSAGLRLAGIARMSGLMVDANVLPEFPGIADAENIAAWDPPFPMNLDLIRPQDEAFWDAYGAAPKAIVNLATAQRLWANRFGKVTTVRIAAGPMEQQALSSALLEGLDLDSFGLTLRPIRQQGLEASAGATDFAGLFLAFSVFLIAAAGLVVGLLFSLSVERRAREVGLRRAIGFPLARVRRELLVEGLLLALVGAILGVALAIAYAAVLIRVITRLWSPMLDLPLLTLYVVPVNVGGAVLGAIALVVLAVVLTVRRLRKVPIPSLLAGAVRVDTDRRSRRRASRLAVASLLLGMICVALAMISGATSSAALFFGAGTLFLIAGLAAFAAWLAAPPRATDRSGASTYASMAARNSAFNPGRSLLSVALVASATFMLVSVAANRRVLRPESLGRDSGTGGFSLVAQSDVPLRVSLQDPDAARELGLGATALTGLEQAEVFPLRLLPGDDASCLNLYQPETPRLVGVSDEMIARGGFAFSSTVERRDNPWTLLHDDLPDGVIPAIGDANSVTWILHSGLGKEIALVDDHGVTVRLRLVGLLAKSIFQSELVISEADFLRHFPDHGGYPYFLIDTPVESVDTTATALEADLTAYGFDATTTVDKLARFLGIEEMYLSTFQLLGGLGLILGTLGLGVVLLRNINERRPELALLRAVGFSRRSIARLILLETAFQLTIGLAVGTVSGFLALLPHVLDTSVHLPWGSLAATLATVIVAGMLSASLGLAAALRTPLLPALKAE